MFSLKNKVIVVTGGNGLLGKQIVSSLRENGAIAIAADITFTQKGENDIIIDITDENSVTNGINEIVKKYNKIDGFVNNAYGTIADKNTNVGKVIAISEDSNGAKNVKGRVYKWVKVNLSQEARKSINKSPNESLLNTFSGSLPSTGNVFAYFREDTITLN